MELVKVFCIRDVGISISVKNTYYQFNLENPGVGLNRQVGKLVLSKQACERHGIKLSGEEAEGRLLRCTFQPRQLQRTAKPSLPASECTFPDLNDVGEDDLLIRSIRREESWSHSYQVGSPSEKPHRYTAYLLTVYSFDPTDDLCHSSDELRSKLTIELTEDEFKGCVALPLGTVFTTQFVLQEEQSIIPPRSQGM